MVTKEERRELGYTGRLGWCIHTTIYKIDNQKGPLLAQVTSMQNSVMIYMGKI